MLARVGRLALVFCLLTGVARAGDVDAIVARAAREGLATTREWLVLGHYRERTFGGWRSEVDAPHFFLAAAGKDDPRAELEATIRAFFAPPVDPEAEQQSLQAQHPQCRFPARFRWLVERLGAEIPARPCPRFEEWRAGLRAQSATLIFASAYLNNPASMFGHTLLRLDRAGQASGGDLLAYAINFAANPTTDFPLVYMIAGLTGGFEGVFSTLPYYLKGDIVKCCGSEVRRLPPRPHSRSRHRSPIRSGSARDPAPARWAFWSLDRADRRAPPSHHR